MNIIVTSIIRFLALPSLILIILLHQSVWAAEVKSTNYIFRDYSFGASNGTGNSANYSLFQTAGDAAPGKVQSANYTMGEGLSFTITAFVPSAPTFTNPSSYYNKLHMVLDTGNNPTDTTFAIAVSPDNFASTTQYVQSDYTLGANPVWQTNTAWGASGFNLIGLIPGTTYSAKVTAMQGSFTQSPFSAVAQVATVNPSLSFSFSPTSVNIGQLTPQTVITAPSTVTVNVDTNGTGGGVVYVYDTNSGLTSTAMGYTIAAVSGDLGVVAEGYGIRGSSASQTSGGPMEILSPYNGSGTNVGTLSTSEQPLFDSTGSPVTGGQAVFEIKAKASNTTKAGTDYADTITLITAATF